MELAGLDRLEARVAEAAEMIRLLREQNREFELRLNGFEEERKKLIEERSTLAERIARLVERVDALRTEI